MDAVIISGDLNRRSRITKKRFYTIVGMSLAEYKKERDFLSKKPPINQWNLNGCNVSYSKSKGRHYINFKFKELNSLILFSKKEMVSRRWVSRVTQICNEILIKPKETRVNILKRNIYFAQNLGILNSSSFLSVEISCILDNEELSIGGEISIKIPLEKIESIRLLPSSGVNEYKMLISHNVHNESVSSPFILSSNDISIASLFILISLLKSKLSCDIKKTPELIKSIDINQSTTFQDLVMSQSSIINDTQQIIAGTGKFYSNIALACASTLCLFNLRDPLFPNSPRTSIIIPQNVNLNYLNSLIKPLPEFIKEIFITIKPFLKFAKFIIHPFQLPNDPIKAVQNIEEDFFFLKLISNETKIDFDIPEFKLNEIDPYESDEDSYIAPPFNPPPPPNSPLISLIKNIPKFDFSSHSNPRNEMINILEDLIVNLCEINIKAGQIDN